MGNFNDPAFVEWLATLVLSIVVALIVASILSSSVGWLLDLEPEHKLWAFIVGFAFLCGLAMLPLTDQRTWGDTLLFMAIPILAVLIYFLPTAAAVSLGQANFQNVFVLNLCFGWTIAGWFIAMYWALRTPEVKDAGDFKITPFGAVPRSKPEPNGPGGGHRV